MGSDSKIEWTHHTFNPWRGCTKMSAGCAHCYAETMSRINPTVLGVWGWRGSRPIAAESYWRLPLRWAAEAAAAGERRRVFCASLADVFEGPETMPPAAWSAVTAARARLFDLIGRTPWLDWLLLTKRPENMLTLASARWASGWPANVWAGTSVEDQATADARIPHLLRVPARVRFLSAEPLLGAVDLRIAWGRCICGAAERDYVVHQRCAECGRCWIDGNIHWVICGGESGPSARPMHPGWARSLRDQCQDAGVAFFFKQWGEWLPFSHGGAGAPRVDYVDQRNGLGLSVASVHRVGKRAAGRMLDGRTWDEFPRGA